MSHSSDYYMSLAIEEAKRAADEDEVPVGAIIVLDHDALTGTPLEEPIIVAQTRNNREGQQNPIGHAELLAIDLASKKLGRWRLTGCSLYITLEPCLMCAGAIILSRIDRVYYGTDDPKAGAVTSLYKVLADTRLNHRPLVTRGLREQESSKLLKDFFAKRR